MKRIGVLAAVFTILGAVPASASGQDPVYRPWTEHTTGVTSLSDCESDGEGTTTCASLLEYSVNATHVGRAELTATGVATLNTNRPCVGPDGATSIETRNETDEVIVSADGSELHSRTIYNGCLGNFTAVRTITGGTGRFAGATGSVNLAGTQTAVVDMTGEGTIYYPGLESDLVRARVSADGSQAVPTVDTDMVGRFQISVNDGEINLRLKVRRNEGTIVAAQIHCGAPGVNGPVGYDLGIDPFTERGGTVVQSSTTALAPNDCGWAAVADLADAIDAGEAYLNVTTLEHPAGEIRGNLSPA